MIRFRPPYRAIDQDLVARRLHTALVDLDHIRQINARLVERALWCESERLRMQREIQKLRDADGVLPYYA